MPKTTDKADSTLRETLEALAAYEPHDAPVVSLYLNLTPDQHGRDNYDAFVRKAFAERVKAFPEQSAERASLERDEERVTRYLADEVSPSANSLALFASSGAEFFRSLQLDAPLPQHELYIAPVPQLYPLARLLDQYPRYASVLLDTNRARIHVFALGAPVRREEVVNEKTRRHAMGGWSQARYQRHVDHLHVRHVKEVVETLDRIVREDGIEHVIVAGDEVAVPLLREQLPKHLEEKVVDVLSLGRDAAEDEIVRATLEVMRRKDAESDAERVRELLDAWRGNGLGVVGPEPTLKALQIGQVDELLIVGTPDALAHAPMPADAPGHVSAQTSAPSGVDERKVQLAHELVARAQQTGAAVRFIEDSGLLARFGGVGAFLRFRL